MTLNDLKLRIRGLLRPKRVEQELHEELAFHVERAARKLVDEGMTQRHANARFGATALAADRCRDERRTSVIDKTIRDVRYALVSRTPACFFPQVLMRREPRWWRA